MQELPQHRSCRLRCPRENTPDSDVDFLVETEPGKSTLFGLGGLINDLEGLLGVDVDVALRSTLRPSCRGMLKDAMPL